MTEEWRPIVGFEGYYLVSNTGKVFSLWKNRLRKPVLNHKLGYYSVMLCGYGIKKQCYVHRLVAEAFCEKPAGCTCVNHKDENRQNNNADNLEWCTIGYNNRYSDIAKHHRKMIAQIKDGDIVAIWESAREAEKHFKTNYKNISAVCRGLRPRAGGYEWRFI